jgi:cytochrome P450
MIAMDAHKSEPKLDPPLSRIPAHVPPHLIFDYDYIADERLQPDVLSGLLSLAREAPDIFFTPRNGGHWVALSHEAAFNFARNHEVFSNEIPGTQLIPISLDPPAHTLYRSVLLSVFAPQKVRELKDKIRALAANLISSVADQDGCELVGTISEPLPVLIFMEIMGIPSVHLRELRDLMVAAMNVADHHQRDIYFADIAKITDEVVRKRQQQRENDLISRLIDTPIDGRPTTFEELRAYILMLLSGGLDTVVNAISFMTRHLALDQKLQEDMRQSPETIPEVIEELLRRYALTVTLRVVREDFTYGQVHFKTGDRLLIHYQCAAIDGRAYPEPERIVVGRKEPAINFGVGRHRCIGSHLARLELEIFFDEWLRRIPTFHIDPDRPVRMHAGHVMAVEHMHLRWNSLKTRTQ